MPSITRCVLLSVPILGACGGSPDTTIDIAHDVCAPLSLAVPDATAAQLAGIDAALASWRTRGAARVSMNDPELAPAIQLRFDEAARAFHGLYDDETSVVYINDAITDPAALAIVVAHELGHAFGLPHIAAAERRSLMNPGNLVTPPTEGDQRALEVLWGRCD